MSLNIYSNVFSTEYNFCIIYICIQACSLRMTNIQGWRFVQSKLILSTSQIIQGCRRSNGRHIGLPLCVWCLGWFAEMSELYKVGFTKIWTTLFMTNDLAHYWRIWVAKFVMRCKKNDWRGTSPVPLRVWVTGGWTWSQFNGMAM